MKPLRDAAGVVLYSPLRKWENTKSVKDMISLT